MFDYIENKDCLVSVLLPVYKEPLEWIKESVESILMQTHRNLEVLILIDCPDRHDVFEWLKSIHDQRIVCHINKTNLGLVETLNIGIKLCHGSYIARMDADDISISNRIELQLSCMEKNNCDLVGSNVLTFNDMGLYKSSKLPNMSRSIKKYIRNGGSIPHPTWLVKKTLYEALGGYRNIQYAEDYDFLVRAMVLGFRLGVAKDICLQYRQNLNGISQPNKGKQKFIARILREQGISNRVYSLDYIYSRIKDSEDALIVYQNYYSYTRKIRTAIETVNVSMFLSEISGFSPRYFGILWYDIMQNIKKKFML